MEVTVFENKALTLMQDLSKLKKQKDEIEKVDKELRDKLQELMTQYGITSFKNDYVTISNIEPSESVTVDLKKFEKEEPQNYKDLLNDYPKVTKKSGYVRIVVK